MTSLASMSKIEPDIDALFFDASDSFEVDSDLDAVHDLSLQFCRGRAVIL